MNCFPAYLNPHILTSGPLSLCCVPCPWSRPLSSPSQEPPRHSGPSSHHPTESPAFRAPFFLARERGVAVCHSGAWIPEPPLVTLLILYSKWDHPFPKARGRPAITLSFRTLSLMVSALSALWAPADRLGSVSVTG